jgi:hypothetical protein
VEILPTAGAEVAAVSAVSGSEADSSAPSDVSAVTEDVQAVPVEAAEDAGATASPPRALEESSPASEPAPTDTMDTKSEPTAAEPEAKRAPEELPIPRAPDDPGPEPADDPEKPRRGLFGYSA